MTPLLRDAIEAHGGLKRWTEVRTISVSASITGAIWAIKDEERAMPLNAFIEATMAMLATDAEEILVGQAPQMRTNPGPQEHGWVNQFNDLIPAGPPLG